MRRPAATHRIGPPRPGARPSTARPGDCYLRAVAERLSGLVRYERSAALPELGASRRFVLLQRPGLRLYVVSSEGLTVESRVFRHNPFSWLAAHGPRPCGHLIVPISGAYIARRSGRETSLEAREALLDIDRIFDERWEGSPFVALCIEWSAEYGEPQQRQGDLRISRADHAFFRALAEALVHDTLSTENLRALFETLRAIGVPLHPVADVDLGAAPRGAVELARAVNAAHMRYDRHPDLADLEARLGISSRQIRRRLQALGPWWVSPGSDWRSTLRRARVLLAPSLATARGATVERVARALGYRSATALHFALDAEGLPSLSTARAISQGRAPG